jgi:hypothetical protein
MQQFREGLNVATSAHRKEIEMATKNQSKGAYCSIDVDVCWSIRIRYRKPVSKDSEGDCMRCASTRRGRKDPEEVYEIAVVSGFLIVLW